MPLQVHRTAAAFAESLSEAEDFRESLLEHGLNLRSDRSREIAPLWGHITQRFCQELVVAAV
jgi:hypothetical protein